MRISPIHILLVLTAILGAIFVLSPSIDLWFSSLFYNATEDFYLKHNMGVLFFYRGMRYVTAAIIIFCFSILLINFITKKTNIISNIQVIYLIAVLAIGPGLLVHTLFKDNWHRARPLQIQEFGGDKKFSPAFVISDQCVKNCSFVSGHASIGFFFVAFALLLRKHRYLAYAGGVTLGFLFGMGRILQGGHFLSDIIFSGITVLLTAHILYIFIFESKYFKKSRPKRS